MASQHPAANTPSDRTRWVIRFAVLSIAAGILAMGALQVWRLTNNQAALYIGVVSAVVTLGALLSEFAAAVAPQVRQLRRFL